MSEEKFRNYYRIPSVRALWHNYNGGFYFITICTHAREHYFGEITKNPATAQPKMILSSIGEYMDEQFRDVQNHYPYADIPLWVVMPDHVHAIIGINHDKIPYERRNASQFYGNDHDVEPRCTTALQSQCTTAPQSQYIADRQSQCTTALHQQIANMQGWLSVTVGGLKRAITHFAKQNHIPFAWQTRFYDRIIRNTDELNRIAQYIENNVENWGKNNPSRT